VDDGNLIKWSEAAAKLRKMKMDVLMQVGYTEEEAWQASRELYILIDPVKESPK